MKEFKYNHSTALQCSLLTSSPVEDADAAISPVVDFVPPQRGVAIRFYPHPRHGVIEDLIVLNEA